MNRGSLYNLAYAILLSVTFAIAMFACAGGEVDGGGSDSDSDSDGDSDGDTDADTDADSDADTDSDADSDSDSDGDCTPVDVVADGSLELGTPNASWDETSTNFGTPICDSNCSSNVDFVPRTGLWYAWFGGAETSETSSLSQSVTLKGGWASIEFYLRIPAATGSTTDFMNVSVDGNPLFNVVTGDELSYTAYTLVTLDASAYADGGAHTLSFDSTSLGSSLGVTDFFVDDIVVNTCL